MKLVKSLLLGSAAGLCAVAGAQAADLPARAAAPVVEYVRVCTAHGAGFFYIPGTDTCLRVGGRVRFEYQYTTNRTVTPGPVALQGNIANGDNSGIRGLSFLNIDSRTSTAYGTVRAFIRFISWGATGSYVNSGTAQRFAQAFPGLAQDTFGRNQTGFYLDKAFVQFAGFTAGRSASFFDFYAHDIEYMGVGTSTSDVSSTNLFAYTATFGGGWSATISVEDPLYRRQPVFSNANYFGPNPSPLGVGPILGNFGSTFVAQVPVTTAANGATIAVLNLDVQQREVVPDVVGVLRYDAPWGAAQLSAAMHEISVGKYQPGLYTPSQVPAGTILNLGSASPSFTVQNNLVVGGQITPANLVALRQPDAQYGYAVQGGVKVNLPQLAAGDALWLQAAYSEGALSYAGHPARLSGSQAVTNPYNRFGVTVTDAIVDNTGQLRLTEAWTVAGAFLHYFTPQWRGAVFGSYAEVNFDNRVRNPGTGANAGAFLGLPTDNSATSRNTRAFSPVARDYNISTVGANLTWSPVRDLDIGVESIYQWVEFQNGRVNDGNKGLPVIAGIPTKSIKRDDILLTRFRVQRDF